MLRASSRPGRCSIPAEPARDAAESLCRLCGEAAGFEFRATVLGRHDVAYYRCSACGFVQSEEPYWLDEAYAHAISSVDTGIMSRNLQLMRITAVLLRLLHMQDGVFLDYGGGHGVFTRLMRDHGFDFRWSDTYAENLFAMGFEGDPERSYEGVTAFEVLEHLHRPRAFFDRILGGMQPPLFLASTEILSEPVDRDWHYFHFSTGQHIAFYQKRTLMGLASAYGYRYIGLAGLHLFSRLSVSDRVLWLMLRYASRLYPLFRFPSLVASDHQRLLRSMQAAGDDKRGGGS